MGFLTDDIGFKPEGWDDFKVKTLAELETAGSVSGTGSALPDSMAETAISSMKQQRDFQYGSLAVGLVSTGFDIAAGFNHLNFQKEMLTKQNNMKKEGLYTTRLVQAYKNKTTATFTAKVEKATNAIYADKASTAELEALNSVRRVTEYVEENGAAGLTYPRGNPVKT